MYLPSFVSSSFPMLVATAQYEGDEFFYHLGSVSAFWPKRSLVRWLHEHLTYARDKRVMAIRIRVEARHFMSPHFQDAFNVLIGNGFRWLGDELFERKIA